MKHKKLFRSVTALLAALVLMGGFSVTAFAGGGDVSDEPPTPVTEERPRRKPSRKKRRAAMSRSPLPRTVICPLWTT